MSRSSFVAAVALASGLALLVACQASPPLPSSEDPDVSGESGRLGADEADGSGGPTLVEGGPCFPAGAQQPCGIDIGECEAGVQICVQGPAGPPAWGPCDGAVDPQQEVCNGLDDNCNGVVDDDPASVGDPCGSDWGECEAGTLVCSGGVLACEGAVGPQPETCNGLDDDCDLQVDDDTPEAGQPCGTDVGACIRGTTACENAQVVCAGGVQPSPEECDGFDNDCNGEVDEDFVGLGWLCGTDEGECSQGALACVAGALVCQGAVEPADETCNQADDDCDGVVDDVAGGCACEQGDVQPCGTDVGTCEAGVQPCTIEGEWGACLGAVGPQPEMCDGLDNDCDDLVDEDQPGAGVPCGVDVGRCEVGVTACVVGELVCAGAIPARAEVCNGLDDDCNGLVDDGDAAGGGQCGTDEGECVAGVWACEPGGMTCEGAVFPAAEECDGLDNDCNGAIDDVPGGCACLLGEARLCGTEVGACTRGLQVCDANGWGPCDGEIGPVPEVCDGLDNDCDGNVDNGNPEGGAGCGTDQGVCVSGVMTCVAGDLLCAGEVGPEPEVCDGLDNDCNGLVDDGVACVATPGDLDPTFEGDGFVVGGIGEGESDALAAVVLPDAAVLIAGSVRREGTGHDLLVARYLPDGTLDGGFGAGGWVATDVGGTDRAYAVAVDGGGGILLGGYGTAAAAPTLARYTPAGAPVGAFGVNGVLVSHGMGAGAFRALALRGDGAAFAAGDVRVAGERRQILVAAWGADGGPLAAFGEGGVTRHLLQAPHDQGGHAVRAMAMGGGGTLHVGGWIDEEAEDLGFSVVLTDTGVPLDALEAVLDASPNGDADARVHGVAADFFDGATLLVGEVFGDMLVVRLGPGGVPDASFGEGGMAVVDFEGERDAAHAVAVDHDGSILVAGRAEVGGVYEIGVARLLPDGSPDLGFGLDGTVHITPELGADAVAQAIALSPLDPTVVVAGRVGGPGERRAFAARLFR